MARKPVEEARPEPTLFKVERGGFRCVRGARKSDSDKFLRRSELEALLRSARDGTYYGSLAYDLFAIGGNLGLRSGEIVELKEANFQHLAHDYLTVFTLKKRVQVEDRLWIGTEERKLLLEIRERRASAARKAAGRLFPYTTRTLRHYFAYYALRAGLSSNVSFHALRHTAARMFLDAAQGDLRFVSERLRHASPKGSAAAHSTFIYTKPTPEEIIAVANRKGVVR